MLKTYTNEQIHSEISTDTLVAQTDSAEPVATSTGLDINLAKAATPSYNTQNDKLLTDPSEPEQLGTNDQATELSDEADDATETERVETNEDAVEPLIEPSDTQLEPEPAATTSLVPEIVAPEADEELGRLSESTQELTNDSSGQIDSVTTEDMSSNQVVDSELELSDSEGQDDTNHTEASAPEVPTLEAERAKEPAAELPSSETATTTNDIHPDDEPALADTEASVAATAVDTSTLFQKDDESPFVVKSSSPSWPLSKKRIIIFLILLVLLIGGSILAGVKQNEQKKTTDTANPTTTSNDYSQETSSTLKTATVSPTSSTVTSTAQTAATPSNTTSTATIQPTATPTPTATPATQPAPVPATPSTPKPAPTQTHKTYTVSYTISRCFSPSKLTITAGDSIKFVNNSKQSMWPITGNHPTHKLLPEFNSRKNIAPGNSYLLTLTKSGTWSYHNEAKLKCGGSITVKA